MATEKYLAGEAVDIYAEIRDNNNALVAPATSVTVTITDPTGTVVVTDGAMSTSSTGIYDYYYITTVDTKYGEWRYVVTTLDTTYPAKKSGTFIIVRF